MFPALRRVSAATLAGYSCYHLCLSPAYNSAADTSCEGAVPGKPAVGTVQGNCVTVHFLHLQILECCTGTVLQGLASPSEPSWLAWGRNLLGVSQTSSLEVPTALPTDKLTCKRRNHQPGTTYKPVVLLSCGSFNPPTYAHLRMFELAAQELTKVPQARFQRHLIIAVIRSGGPPIDAEVSLHLLKQSMQVAIRSVICIAGRVRCAGRLYVPCTRCIQQEGARAS